MNGEPAYNDAISLVSCHDIIVPLVTGLQDTVSCMMITEVGSGTVLWRHPFQMRVSSDENGHCEPDFNGTQYYGYSLGISAIPSGDYDFAAWNDGNTDNPRYVFVSSDTYLSAGFALARTRVTYNSNTSPNQQVVSEPYRRSDEYVISSPSDIGFSRDGYSFLSWNTKSDGTGTSYQPGDSVNMNKNRKLYATWRMSYEKRWMRAGTYTENLVAGRYRMSIRGGDGGSSRSWYWSDAGNQHGMTASGGIGCSKTCCFSLDKDQTVKITVGKKGDNKTYSNGQYWYNGGGGEGRGGSGSASSIGVQGKWSITADGGEGGWSHVFINDVVLTKGSAGTFTYSGIAVEKKSDSARYSEPHVELTLIG